MAVWRSLALVIGSLAFFVAQASAQVLLRDTEIEEFLYDMSEPVWQAAGLPEGGVEILLIGDPSLNAFAGASSGLKMGVHTGLITQAKTPNEIEGVIAHEAGHLAGGHSARTAEVFANAGKQQMLGLLLGAALLAAGAPPEAGIGAIGLGQSAAMNNYLTYSRGQESAADQAAITYLDHIGHSSAGLLDFFDNLRNQQLIRSRAPVPYLQTHPLAVQRVARLRSRAETSPYWGQRDDPEDVEQLRLIQAKIHGFLDEPQVALRRYPLSDQSDPARYARAVAYYRASDLTSATREVDKLLAAYPDNPYYHELKGQMLFEHGKIAEAIPSHRRSTELKPDAPLLQVNLARALIATERDAEAREAVAILKLALGKERDNAFGWSLLARAYATLRETDLASLAQAEAAYHMGDVMGAHRFATLAQDKFSAGTPEHQQALDIILATAEAAREMGRRTQRRR
jgi:predicted Zn-dependent protease